MWREISPDCDIALVRISSVIAFGAVAISAVLYGVSRHSDQLEAGNPGSIEPAAERGNVRSDSVRSLRAAVRKRIADSAEKALDLSGGIVVVASPDDFEETRFSQHLSCPGCGRTTSTVFQELAQDIQAHIRASMPQWRQQYPGVEELSVAVMGCIVNGPGESKHADIGISLPGTGETPAAPVFVDGKKAATLRGENIAREFTAMVEAYVERRFG